jgi:hypothetical protein
MTADNSKSVARPVVDKSNWEWVTVPEEDLFGEEHTGVSINFNQYGPGKHFVDPESAGEIRRLLDLRLRGDMRVLQPGRDKKMEEIMSRNGKRVPNQADLVS